ncbi:hypothetical protein HMPREF1548_02026 [Clostridium sp. KLE 1755]|nr:hypothetical protein HMPREF1548_02026 [Clostridium sp. KLE 1755]
MEIKHLISFFICNSSGRHIVLNCSLYFIISTCFFLYNGQFHASCAAFEHIGKICCPFDFFYVL